ncbi:MAG: Na/Pi symporter, partial [Bacteroidota bacterium]
EMKYRFLERLSGYLTSGFNVVSVSERPVIELGLNGLLGGINEWFINSFGALITLGLAILILFYCLKSISKLLYHLLIGRINIRFKTTLFSSWLRSFGWGLLLTSAIQSSSLTTSLIIPLVATGKVKMIRAFQFILGANIGTTITALLAATFQSKAAISLAIVHLLFNLIGVCVFLFIPVLKGFPIYLSDKMARFTIRMRIAGFVYILFAFFLLPFTLIYSYQELDKTHDAVEVVSED